MENGQKTTPVTPPTGPRAQGTGGKTTQAPTNGDITSKTDTIVDIKAGMSIEEVVALDSKGMVLRFHLGKEFLELPDSIVTNLSRVNRLVYHQLAQAQSDYSPEADKDAKDLVVGATMGRARDKLEKLTLPKGRHYRWARPDRIEANKDRGYRITPADVATTFLGPKNGHHEIGAYGATPELVLMDCDQNLFEQHMKEKGKRNRELIADKRRAIDNDIIQAGGKPVGED